MREYFQILTGFIIITEFAFVQGTPAKEQIGPNPNDKVTVDLRVLTLSDSLLKKISTIRENENERKVGRLFLEKRQLDQILTAAVADKGTILRQSLGNPGQVGSTSKVQIIDTLYFSTSVVRIQNGNQSAWVPITKAYPIGVKADLKLDRSTNGRFAQLKVSAQIVRLVSGRPVPIAMVDVPIDNQGKSVKVAIQQPEFITNSIQANIEISSGDTIVIMVSPNEWILVSVRSPK